VRGGAGELFGVERTDRVVDSTHQAHRRVQEAVLTARRTWIWDGIWN
jgi:hypothetical protein